jgi:hypothetical protein
VALLALCYAGQMASPLAQSILLAGDRVECVASGWRTRGRIARIITAARETGELDYDARRRFAVYALPVLGLGRNLRPGI